MRGRCGLALSWAAGALLGAVALLAAEPDPRDAPAVGAGSVPRDAELVVGPQENGQENFVPLFNGRDLTGWAGALKGYAAKDGVLTCLPDRGGRIYTEDEYGDFVLRFEFKLSAAANNGLTIRTPPGGEGAKDGMEIQILDDSAPAYKDAPAWYRHGSIYGVVPAKMGHLRPVGEWNFQEVIARGRRITVRLNGATILDADLAPILASGETADGLGVMNAHHGLHRTTGRIGFIGSGSRVEFRNLRIKPLK